MCPHNHFEIIYYADGIMFRRCKNCGRIEVRFDYDWNDLAAIQKALEAKSW